MKGISGQVTVRERIDPQITATLFANYRTSADALMELVDNALDARLPGRLMEVELTVHPTTITVMSRGGQGMGWKDLERHYLRWGKSAKRGRNLIGQYGQGGKAAIGHLGARFTVEASRPEDGVAWKFADPDYRNRSRLKTYEVETIPKRVDGDVGYVRVRIDGVDKRVDPRRLGQRLADTYRPLLAGGELTLAINGAFLAPRLLGEGERRDFSVRAAGTTIKGWMGLLDPQRRGPDFIPGLRCYRLGRLVTQGEFFGHPSPAQRPGMAQLIGEVEIPIVPLTINKTDFERDGAAWVAIENRLHRALAPLARRLARDSEPPPPASAVRVAEQVRRLLSQALRLAERPELFPGAAPAARAKAATPGPGSAQLPLDGEPRESSPRAPAKPPPEPQARRRGFGDILIKPLDETVRSQTLIEKGVNVVVINSRYPLFVERKGDVWYVLETAAREVCKAIEAASVAEYERRVNEILLLAFRLRGRRRKPGLRARQLTLTPS